METHPREQATPGNGMDQLKAAAEEIGRTLKAFLGKRTKMTIIDTLRLQFSMIILDVSIGSTP